MFGQNRHPLRLTEHDAGYAPLCKRDGVVYPLPDWAPQVLRGEKAGRRQALLHRIGGRECILTFVS